MPIRLVDFPEPLSAASWRLAGDTAVIQSDAWRVLTAELDRYCRGELAGRSFLISGHRGAGKTTLVLNAFQHVWKNRERRQDVRPLLVPVNGPALFHAPSEPTPTAPDLPASDQARHPRDPSAPTGATDSVQATAPGRDPDDDLKPAQFALKQIVLALHRAVVEEMCSAHRQRVLESTPPKSALRRERLELSAQLEMELFECPMPARLREFWSRAGLLETGALFQAGAPILTIRPNQGLRELLALAGVCEAYCRVSGTYTEAQKRSEDAARRAEASLAGNASGPLLAPVASLIAGALVGVGVAAADGPGVAALVAGIMSSLGAAAVFKYSAARSSGRSVTRELSFMPDLSVRTLDRFVPLLVRRLVNAGLAPVFVVDELDKVENLPERMVELLRGLKKIFAETAFFCFVTDREYFEELRRITSDGAYPPASTYFSHQLFIVYAHDDLHRYLAVRLKAVEGSP
ncbi:hypothetical protein [Longimicrobium sp.]|jgi:hypothetical protein|uniref:hypothetical protein n=1 Tax=Longimicrobium sp. TaxID=2029185 RepID=UPI002F95D1D4